MEPVTHVLTGACLARTGFNRRAAYATAAMAIAAEFPDIDTVWGLRGPVSGFEHHRGITHTFLGIPFEAALLLLGFVVFHSFRKRRSSKAERAAAPVRWGMLYLLLLLALLSHLFLDYTNNYGLRPFFPFNDRWYAGSFVFIFDPLLFGLLLAGLLLPSLFGLINREIGARREPFHGRIWARAALLGVLLLWAVRWFEHGRAVALAQGQTLRAPGVTDALNTPEVPEPGTASPPTTSPVPALADTRPLLQPRLTLASPDPFNVFRWYTATDFGPAYQLGIADTHLDTWMAGSVLTKPASGPMLLAAERSRLGRIYLDWSPMPVLRLLPGAPPGADLDPSTQAGDITGIFSDPRFMGDTPLLSNARRPPLTGEVVLDPSGRVVIEGMDGRFGKYGRP